MSPRATGKRAVSIAPSAGHVALICRISKDKSGRVEGVRAQERWGRAYAAQRWPGVPVVVYADNDLSAADDTHRPEFERFRSDVAAGLVSHVWAVEQSRLERREAEWFRLAAELDAAGVAELHTNRDGIIGVHDVMAGIKAVLNAAEVRTLRRRVNDRLAENAANGIPAGSRPFGYVHGRKPNGDKTLIVVDDEAKVIRECAERVLSGWSLASIARDLVQRGVTGPHRVSVRDKTGAVVTVDGRPVEDGGVPVTRPGTITYASVKNWVTRPTVAGLRVHRDEIVGAGNWPAILDEATWRACRNKLAAPRVALRSDGGTYPVSGVARTSGRRYLLTGGIAVCGVCGAALVATNKQLKRGRRPDVPYYVCHPKNGGRGCIGIMAERFEEYVAVTLFDELDRPEFLAALAADENAARRDAITTGLAALDEQRAELAKMWGRRELTGDEWRIAREQLAEQERSLRIELASMPPAPSHADPSAVREAWPLMTLDERREIVGMFVARVTVNRARPGTKGFDPSRVAPPETWWRRG